MKMIYIREEEFDEIKARADKAELSFSKFLIEKALGKKRTISDYFRRQPS